MDTCFPFHEGALYLLLVYCLALFIITIFCNWIAPDQKYTQGIVGFNIFGIFSRFLNIFNNSWSRVLSSTRNLQVGESVIGQVEDVIGSNKDPIVLFSVSFTS